MSYKTVHQSVSQQTALNSTAVYSIRFSNKRLLPLPPTDSRTRSQNEAIDSQLNINFSRCHGDRRRTGRTMNESVHWSTASRPGWASNDASRRPPTTQAPKLVLATVNSRATGALPR